MTVPSPEEHRTATTSRGRTPRSRRDRAAIVIPAGRNHLPELWKVALEASNHGSTHDYGPITAWSWPDSGANVASFEANLRKLRHIFESYDAAQVKPLPRRCKSASTSAPITHDLRPNSPSKKSHVLSSLFWTFDQFVKELSEFQGRSLVHRDPPRLDSIPKGLERDWSRIPPWFHRIFPLNSENPWEMIRANSL